MPPRRHLIARLGHLCTEYFSCRIPRRSLSPSILIVGIPRRSLVGVGKRAGHWLGMPPANNTQFFFRSALTLGSLFTGAGIMHAILKPDLVRVINHAGAHGFPHLGSLCSLSCTNTCRRPSQSCLQPTNPPAAAKDAPRRAWMASCPRQHSVVRNRASYSRLVLPGSATILTPVPVE